MLSSIVIYWNGAEPYILFWAVCRCLCSTDLSREFTLKGGQARSLHNADEHCGELTPDTNSVFHLKLHLQRVFSFSAKTKPLHFHFFTASKNVILVHLSPGRPDCRQPSLTTVHRHQHFLGTILWGRTDRGEKNEIRIDLEWFSHLMCIKIRQGACSNPAAEGFRPEFLIPLVLGWGPKARIPTSPRVTLLPTWGPHCEKHWLRGLSPTPEGSQLWGNCWGVLSNTGILPQSLVYPQPHDHRPWVPFSTGSANTKKGSQ